MSEKKWFVAVTDEMVLKVREDAFDLPLFFIKHWKNQRKNKEMKKR